MEKNRNLFWKLVESEHLKARAFCRKLTGSRENGDDLYQDSLVHALSKFNSLRKIKAFRPWLYRIIINKFKNSVRRPWWKTFSPMTKEIEESIGGNDPFTGYLARRRISKAFKILSANEQALVTMYEMDGWSVTELAKLHGKSNAAIKMKLSRIRARMRKELTKLPPSNDREAVKIFNSEDEICVATKQGKN